MRDTPKVALRTRPRLLSPEIFHLCLNLLFGGSLSHLPSLSGLVFVLVAIWLSTDKLMIGCRGRVEIRTVQRKHNVVRAIFSG